jgi:hypothetical protein
MCPLAAVMRYDGAIMMIWVGMGGIVEIDAAFYIFQDQYALRAR